MRAERAVSRWRLHPARVLVIAFAIGVLVGTALLALPIARAGDGSAPFVTALFTATSAVCVTGLAVVDTPAYWSGFGEGVILALAQIGGFGIMTLTSLLVIVMARRLNLRTRLATQSETRALGLGDVRRVVRGVAIISFTIESVAAVILGLRFWAVYDLSPGIAAYHGVFHAVSGFNSAGFALYGDGLIRFAGDPVVSLTLALLIIAGSLGFPVLFELRRELLTPRTWSLHTRLVVYSSAVLVAVGTAAVTALEWGNRATLGALSVPDRFLAGFFQGVTPRSGGLNTVDYGAMDESTLLVTDALMFIGGAPAGTAGGIKVTTAVLLILVVVAEARGDSSVHLFRRRLPPDVLRQAVAITMLSAAAVAASTLALLLMTGFTLDQVLFEVISAVGTTGLSTGITPALPVAGQVLVVVLMFVGRIGPITLATALALRSRQNLYRLPEERPIVG